MLMSTKIYETSISLDVFSTQRGFNYILVNVIGVIEGIPPALSVN